MLDIVVVLIDEVKVDDEVVIRLVEIDIMLPKTVPQWRLGEQRKISARGQSSVGKVTDFGGRTACCRMARRASRSRIAGQGGIL